MRTSKKAAVVGGTVATLMAGGVAFAAWTSTGTNTGTAGATTDAGLGVSVAAVSGLYPTGTQDQGVTVTNNNVYPVTMDSLVPTVSSDDASICKITSDLVGAATDRLAAGASVTYHFTVGMGADASDTCKNATFTIKYDASAHSTD